MKPIGYIYLTTCLVNNKIYIGKHELNGQKSYIGSGTLFKRAVKKYGKENFKRKILKLCYSLHELRVWEHVYIVKHKSYIRSIGYNIAKGDVNTSEYNPAKAPEVREKIRAKIKERGGLRGANNPMYRRKWSDNSRIQLSNSLKRTYKINGHPRIGKTHSDETKKILSEKKKQAYLGKGNPMYGSRFIWINNGVVNKRGKIDEPIPKGWIKGMICGTQKK